MSSNDSPIHRLLSLCPEDEVPHWHRVLSHPHCVRMPVSSDFVLAPRTSLTAVHPVSDADPTATSNSTTILPASLVF